MPDAGAAGTSAASLGSCKGGKATYGPRGRGTAVAFRGACTAVVEEDGLLAIADVERKLVGRLPSVVPSEDPGAPLESLVAPGSLPSGKDVGLGGGCACGAGLDNPLVETDWERCRIEGSEAFLRLWLWLFDDKWPGVWLRMGRARSRASSCSEVGEDNWIFCDRMVLDLVEAERSDMFGMSYRGRGNGFILGSSLGRSW